MTTTSGSSRNLLALICLCMILQLVEGVDYCTGRAGLNGGCSQQFLKKDCTEFTGCEWNIVMAKCQGYPTLCTDIVDCELCNNHGACSWYDIGASSDHSVCKTTAPETTEDYDNNYNDDLVTNGNGISSTTTTITTGDESYNRDSNTNSYTGEAADLDCEIAGCAYNKVIDAPIDAPVQDTAITYTSGDASASTDETDADIFSFGKIGNFELSIVVVAVAAVLVFMMICLCIALICCCCC